MTISLVALFAIIAVAALMYGWTVLQGRLLVWEIEESLRYDYR